MVDERIFAVGHRIGFGWRENLVLVGEGGKGKLIAVSDRFPGIIPTIVLHFYLSAVINGWFYCQVVI